MKKYILKKDLPLAKAGTIVTLRKSETASNIFNENNNRLYAIINNTDINEWFEEIPEKPKSVWELKEGDECYSIDSEDDTIKLNWGFDSIVKALGNIGWIFLSKEEAEKELQKRKAIQKIKKYCWENNIDTEHNSEAGNSYGFSLNNIGEVAFFDEFRNGNPLGYFSYKDGKKILYKFEEELKIILE